MIAERLNADSETMPAKVRLTKVYRRTCTECGRAYEGQHWASQFCAPSCRRDFNNRRQKRGAELYDLFMATRFERDQVGPLGIWRELNRLASNFREEDVKRRGGRKSWQPPKKVIARLKDLGQLSRAL